MAEELENIQQPQQNTPQQPSYIDGVYSNLEQAYGKDNLPDKNTFISKMNDKNYRDGIHKNLINAYGTDNVPDFDTFEDKLGLKKNDITTTQKTSTSLDGTSQSNLTPENFDINKVLGTPKTGIGVPSNVSESTKVVQPLQTKHLANVLPVMKDRAVKDITLQRLQKQGKSALVGSNDYNAEKEFVQNNIQDADWMPHDLLKPESQDKIKKEAVNNFAAANNESPENIEQNLQNGKYKLEDGKIKEVGGFGDNFSQGVRDFVNNIGLAMNVSAAQSRGNDNEIKYYLNEFNKNKKNERETTATDVLGKSGKMLGSLTPYLAATAVAPYADVPLMGLSNLGENNQQIWNDPNLSEDQKIKAINNTSTDAFMTGNLQGMAFHSIGAGNEKTTANSLLSKYAPTANLKQKITQNLYNSFGDLLKTSSSDVVKAASIGAGTELLNDMSKTKEGVKVDFSNVGESALQMGALDLIMKAPKVLTHAYGVLKDAVSSGYDKVNPDWYNQYSKQTQDALNAIVAAPDNIYKQAISQLDISPDPNAQNAKQKIETFRGYYNSLPSDLSNEAKNKALHILQLKTEAISYMNDATDDGIKKIYEGRAKAYDGILNKLVESGNVDTKKEPLLLPRFAATIPQKGNAQPFIDEANKLQQPTETKITPTEEVNKPIGETKETIPNVEDWSKDVESTANKLKETEQKQPSLWQKIKDAFYSGIGKLSEGFKTTQDFIKNAVGTKYEELAKTLQPYLQNVETTLFDDFKSDVSKEGDYSSGGKIRINNKTVFDKLHIFFHEALHHITFDKITEFEKNPNSKKLKSHEVEAILNLKRIFKKVTEELNRKEGGYGTQKGGISATNFWKLKAEGDTRGFANVHEFISEAFSNTEFQKILSQFEGEGKSPNLFKQFLNAIGKLLGLKDNTILDDIFHHTEKLLDENKSEHNDISEAYHKAKADGSNPELVKAVEDLLGKPTEQPETKSINESTKNKIQQPTEVKKPITEEINKPIGEAEETKPTGEESIIPSEKGAGKVKPVKIAGTEVGEHGEDVNTEKGLENGVQDTELTNKGVEQSKDLGKYISEKGKTDIISSEVGRAKKTAEIAAAEAEKINRQDLPNLKEGTPLHESTKVNRTTNPLLNTWNIGEDDGKPVGSFDEEYYVNHPNEKPKGGESFNEFKDRMPDAYKAVEDMPKTTQVVAHSKVLRAFRALEETNKDRTKGEPVKWTPETTKNFLELKEETPTQPKETTNVEDWSKNVESKIDKTVKKSIVNRTKKSLGVDEDIASKIHDIALTSKDYEDFKRRVDELGIDDTVAKNIHAEQYGEIRDEAKSAYQEQLKKNLEDLREGYSDVTRSKAGLRKITEKSPSSIRNFVNRILHGTTPEGVEKSKARLADIQKQYRKEKAEMKSLLPRERGVNFVVEKISRAARNGEISQLNADLAIDLLRTNPSIFEDLAISITKKSVNDESGVQGWYRAADALVKVFKGGTDETTAVHEILHHTERFLPNEIRDKIIKEWHNEVNKQIEHYQKLLKNTKNVDERQQITQGLLYLGLALERQVEPNRANVEAMEKIMSKYLGDHTDSKGNFHKGLGNSWYQLYNPSEWWAVNASRILKEAKTKPELKTFYDKVKAFYDGLILAVKKIFNNPYSAVEKGLKTILNGETLEYREGAMLSASKKLLNIKQKGSFEDRLKSIYDEVKNKQVKAVEDLLGKPKEKEQPTISEPKDAFSKQTTGEMGEPDRPKEPTTEGTGQQPTIKEKTVANGEGESKAAGLAQRVQEKRRDALGLKNYERGNGWNKKEALDRGKQLSEEGMNVKDIFERFNKDNRISPDEMARLQYESVKLAKETTKAADEFGEDSEQYKSALKLEDDFLNKAQEIKTATSKLFTAQQGEVNLDTESFNSVKRELENVTDRKLNSVQTEKIKELTETNKKLKKQLDETEKKLVEESNKNLGKEEDKKTFTERAKKVADTFRKLKQKEFTFKDENGNDVPLQKMGISWNDLVELGAKAIEKSGEIADGIKAIIDEVKDSEWYKKLSEKDKDRFSKELEQYYEGVAEKKAINEKELSDLQKQFVDKKDDKFTAEESKSIWEYAKKTYLDKGVNYRDMIGNVSNDLGLSWKQVSNAITTPKLKPISDVMWKQRSQLLRNQNATKRWIENQNKHKLIRAYTWLTGGIRGVAVFGHGGIFVGTHAAPTLFNLSKLKYTIPAFFRGWKFSYGNVANYERAMEQLRHRDNYLLAQRAGLQNNPDHINSEEFQKSQNFLGRLGGAGERGFNAIKVLRQDLFDYEFSKLKDYEKLEVDKDGVPLAAKRIAELINNGTGATNLKIPNVISEVTFAGGMEAARWGKLLVNPVKATTTALETLKDMATGTKSVPASDKVFMKVWAKRVGEQLATMTGVLIANSALQNMINPKNPVNITNPTSPKRDFMKFKFGDITLDMSSGMLGTFNFLTGLAKIATEPQKELRGDTRQMAFGKSAIGYARGKLSPAYSTIYDVATHTDFSGNVLPFASDEPKSGKHRLTWGEYAWEKAPLPIAEAAKITYESALENGADKSVLDNIMKGVMLGAISGSTGFRITELHDSIGIKDVKSPEYEFLREKNERVVPYSKEKLKPVDIKGNEIKVTDENYKKFIDERENYIKNDISRLINGELKYANKDNKEKPVEIPDEELLKLPQEEQLKYYQNEAKYEISQFANKHDLSKDEVQKLTPEELNPFLMTITKQADKKAMWKVFKGVEKEKPQSGKKIIAE